MDWSSLPRPVIELDLCENLTELVLPPDIEQTVEVITCRMNRRNKLTLNCPKLRVLDCKNSMLTKIKLNCPNLNYLNCGGNQLTKIKLRCPKLEVLICWGNQLTHISFYCPNLDVLSCHHNNITSLYNISSLPNTVIIFNISDNPVSDQLTGTTDEQRSIIRLARLKRCMQLLSQNILPAMALRIQTAWKRYLPSGIDNN